ncbi:MAG TPA: acyl-CoA dehydrogenase [Steroidobacteraceae bacterium]|nr:acyl-CoA dehydrogenase [Steroidobacteraceae bacterium]
MTYEAPLALMRAALAQAADASGARGIAGYEETLNGLAEPVLESAARFAREVLSPLNGVADRSPPRLAPHGVVTPPGFVEAYGRFRQDGWVSLCAATEHGGQGLPMLIAAAVTEMWAGANLSFAMCPELAVGALEMMRAHASHALIEQYAARLAGGEWTATMCLTEPQAGSDLSLLRTRAEPDGDAWRLYGRKIFISWGDHDLTDNIVHFVLARAPDAPSGLKGISLFLVPKKFPTSGGLRQNDIQAVSLEHKMGIRASPTCVMALGEREGARGWLVGRLHEGLVCMFTTMNHMRLGVGLHSLGLSERALQLARGHARERIQGHDAAGHPRAIIRHADVRRMLLTMKALTHASRCLAYTAAATLDVSRHGSDQAARARAAQRVDLLTPVVKAWCSEVAVEVASLGVQVHGGAGYIDDAEISQIYRDARIGPIFEGTNYIQAQDLLARKVIRGGGLALAELIGNVAQDARKLPPPPHALGFLRAQLLDGGGRVLQLANSIMERHGSEPDLVGAAAHHFLHALGALAGGWQWALSAAAALAGPCGSHAQGIIDTATFYAAQILPRMHAHETAIRCGSQALARAAIDEI